MLIDPKDIMAGSKGYVKCDLSVIGKGEQVKVSRSHSQLFDNCSALHMNASSVFEAQWSQSDYRGIHT